MKWRAWIPALFVILLFVTAAHFYNRGFVHQKSHGVILMIANGLDQEILNQARLKAAARGQKLFLDHMPTLGGNQPQAAFLTVQGFETSSPDEAAAATMLATGVKVRNGFTSFTPQGQRLDSLMYRAQSYGRGTGIVTTGEITLPTPVSFYGFIQGNESAEYRNAAELIDSSKVDVIMGGGARYFRPLSVLNERGRSDGRHLEKDATKWGYAVVNNAQEMEKLPAWRTRQCLGLFHHGPFYFSALVEGTTTMPTLSDMTRRSIEFLQYNLRGYFLVVEGALIAQACRSNFTELAVDEAIAFDEAVKTAVSYAGKESTVIVLCGYSYGALPSQSNSSSILIEKSISKDPEWLLGPGGVPTVASEKIWQKQRETEGVFSTTANHPLKPGLALQFARQARPVMSPGWLIANGFGSDQFSGTYSATDLFSKIEHLFK
ncbi:MAG: alkaline phosphatase [Verrucomicrobiota bacterium]